MKGREAIQNALYDRIRLGLVPNYVKSVTRTLKEFPPASSQQPAVAVVAGDEDASGSSKQPPIWNLRGHIFVAVWDTYGKGESTLLHIIDHLEVLFELTSDESISGVVEGSNTTLGGLVHRAGIVGTIELYVGSTGEQTMAIVPVSMLVT